LASGDTVLINLGKYAFTPKLANDIYCWTTEPNGLADSDASNDTIKITNLYAALSGTYTIGGIDPDYKTFNEAVTALVQSGIAGNVTFKVRDGKYNEQVSVPKINGSSANAKIVFESEKGDSTSVSLIYSSTDYAKNYTLQINGSENLEFHKLKIEAQLHSSSDGWLGD
jgi:pectin methylesterase-like acyl-CoA thioesterase